ncbi:uncharacterized protein LOC116426474 isoform X2 [Nomia melanderi]|uniref:uncharacterized protein LOC116426474 isoform X2 n=1 Tax=Nomia melanderi TaxID=2448451 RepID=UPI003FCD13EA
MLLSLLRLTMIVPLLVSAVSIVTNSDKLSFVSPEGSKSLTRVRQSGPLAKEDEDSIVRKRQASRNRISSELNLKSHGMHALEGRISRSGNENLARKMAKDALKSPKMQETMKKLSRGGDPKKKKLFVSVKVPAPPRSHSRLNGETRKNGRRARIKGRKKKKRKRHHRRHRKERAEWPRRVSAKRTLNNRGNENSKIEYDRSTVSKHREKNKPSVSKSTDKITGLKVDDEDYVDFSTISSVTRKHVGSVKSRSAMIESLMKTTTKDPLENNTDDQGSEYSDYYSEDDVLQDIVANKIPINVAELTNPNDRFVRQARNSTVYRSDDRIDIGQPYYHDYDTRSNDFRHTDYSADSLNDFQRYPSIRRRAGLKRAPRLLGSDDTLLYQEPSYRLPDDRIESSVYVVSTEESPQLIEQDYIAPEPRDNFGVFDATPISQDIQQPVVSQNLDPFHYSSQYDKSLDTVEPQTILQSENSVVEVPRASHKLTALDLQNLYNYRHFGNGLQHFSNIDQSVYGQPQLISNMGDLNYQNQGSQSIPVMESSNLPAVNIPNAMDQPLGKVLESLGISVHIDSPNSNGEDNVSPPYLNNVADNANDPSLSYYEPHDRPTDHALASSSCDKVNTVEDTRQASNGKDDNIKLRGDHRRRQLFRTGLQNGNLFSLLEGEKNGNMSDSMQNTKVIASQLLDTIMEELAELKLDSSKSSKKEGSWSTAQAGVKLDMKVVNHSIIVTLSALATPRYHETLLNGTWNVSGHAPFNRGSPFTLIATDNTTNSMAVFVGACRVCQGIDTIAGVWSVARSPKDCRDFQVATSVFNDIFRKTELSSLKETQNTTISKNGTAEHKKKRS